MNINALAILTLYWRPKPLSLMWKQMIILMNVCEKHYNGTMMEYGHHSKGSGTCWNSNRQDENSTDERTLSLSLSSSSYHLCQQIPLSNKASQQLKTMKHEQISGEREVLMTYIIPNDT